jgi:hypothetical protein
MKYYRCDRCKKELTTEEMATPFIRLDKQMRAVASVLVFDDRGKQMEEICDACKAQIVLEGTPQKVLVIPDEYLKDTATPIPTPMVAVMAAPAPEEQARYERSAVSQEDDE